MVEAPDEESEGEHVLEGNEASDEELEAEYQEAVTMLTIAKQRRTEVDRAKQFLRKPQSSEDRKARIDKLKQRLPCAKCGQLGHWKDDNDRRAKVKVVNFEETEEHVTEEPLPTISDYNLLITRERTVCHHERCDRHCMRRHPGWDSLV